MRVLDTTLLIDFLKGNKDAIRKMQDLEGDEIATTMHNVFEVTVGIYKKNKGTESELISFERMLAGMAFLDFDWNSSLMAAQISVQMIRSGKEINLVDCFIAGSMASKGYDTIVTRDVGHFNRIKGIKVEKY